MKTKYNIIGIFILAFLLLPAVHVSAQSDSFSINFPNPCTGDMETITGTVFFINDEPYVRYTYFGHTREFHMRGNWQDDFYSWAESIANQEMDDCDWGTVDAGFSNPAAGLAMNSSVRALQNELFMLDFFQPEPSESSAVEGDEETESDDGVQHFRQFNATSDISSYNADGYSATGSAYGLSYIGLFSLGTYQVGANLDGLRFMDTGADAADPFRQTLWGVSFKQSKFDETLQRAETDQLTVNMIQAESIDFGVVLSGMQTFRTRREGGGMVNRGYAATGSVQSFDDGDVLILDIGFVYGTLRSRNFTDRLSGSINALFLANLTDYDAYMMDETGYTAIMAGGRFGGSLFYNVFQGAGFQISLSYTPSTYVYVSTEGPDGGTYSESGFDGASSFSFNSGFTYRF